MVNTKKSSVQLPFLFGVELRTQVRLTDFHVYISKGLKLKKLKKSFFFSFFTTDFTGFSCKIQPGDKEKKDQIRSVPLLPKERKNGTKGN